MRTGRPPLPLESRFERVTESGCWIFTGALDGCGYGHVWQNRKAHRIFFEAYVGPIPKGLKVCHRCDVPCCVNPAHLFLGTDADNRADSVAKGRHAKGERSGMAKLTDALVAEILESNEQHLVLARRYGVSPPVVRLIRLGRIWKHVPRPKEIRYARWN